MATRAEQICPICQEAINDLAYVTSCFHEFCLGCIVLWIKRNPSCPLCRRPVWSIIHSVESDREFLEMALPQPSQLSAACRWAEQEAAMPVARAYVAGIPPETWALFFRSNREVLEPVQFWLSGVLYAACSWDVAYAQGRIISTLCCYGLGEEVLVRKLQPLLREQTVVFVRQLIDFTANQCRDRIRRQVAPQGVNAAEGGRPIASRPVALPAGMAATNAIMQGELHERLEQVVPSTSRAGQSRICFPRATRRPMGRAAVCSQGHPAHKRPCHRQN